MLLDVAQGRTLTCDLGRTAQWQNGLLADWQRRVQNHKNKDVVAWFTKWFIECVCIGMKVSRLMFSSLWNIENPSFD